jgi:hypothetical protein
MLTTLLATALTASPGDAVSNGHVNALKKPVTLTSQRRITLVGPGSTPVTSGGLVFLSAVHPTIPKGSKEPGSLLYAFSRTGALAWHASYATFPTVPPVPAYLTAPADSGGAVYVGWNREGADQYDGAMDAFHATTGKLIFQAGQGGTSAPTVAGGNVYSNWQFNCCFDEQNAEATQGLNAATGDAVFTTDPGLGTPTAPAAAAGGLLYVATGGTLNVFDALGHTGCGPPPYPSPPYSYPSYCAPLWTDSAPDTITGTPRIVDGTLFVGAADDLNAYPASGCGAYQCMPVWTASANGPLTTSPTSTAKLVFIASQKGTLYAFPVAGCGHSTCSPRWTGSVGGALTAPTISGATVYVGSSKGIVYGFNLAGCSKPQCSPTLEAHVKAPVVNAPVVDDGYLFVTDTAHTLHIFKLP